MATIATMTTRPEARYLFPHTVKGEGERLSALAVGFDPVTKRHLAALGLAPGWRCLEVGAGAGTIARWLAEVVGPKGRVVATDLSVGLMEDNGLGAVDNVELRTHDIVHDPLPEGEFDLVHSRLVLEHLPARQEALATMARALAPGGWLVVEDFCFRGQHATDLRGAMTISAMLRLVALLMRQHGHDGHWAARLPVHLRHAGLTAVGAEGTQPILFGASPTVDWARPSLVRLRNLVLEDGDDIAPSPVQRILAAAPPLRRLLTRQFDGFDRLLDDPDFCYVAPTFVTAWGQRPLEP
jgi:SAM-dependent methyltransferase